MRLRAEGRGETGSRGTWICRTYLAATLLVTVGGLIVVARLEPGAVVAAGTGAGVAWLLQALAFWRLVVALRGGRQVLRVWVGGIGARAGGLVVIFAAGVMSAWSLKALLLGYGIEILVLLLLEAVWLAAAGSSIRGVANGTAK